MMLKSGPSWRQIVSLDNIDICALANGFKTIPFLDAFRTYVKKTYPGIPFYCPIKPGSYYAPPVVMPTHYMNYSDSQNMTFDEIRRKNENAGDLGSSFTPNLLPNGLYRHIIKLYNDLDPIGFCIYWHNEHYVRLNEDNF